MGRTHPNVLKLRKERRKGRRAYLKSYFGEIKVSSGPGKSGIPESQLSYFDYRKRGNTYWDAYLEAKFPTKPMASQRILAKRLEIIDRLNHITLEDSADDFIPDVDVIVLRRGGITKTIIKFLFTPKYDICYFVKEDWLNMVIHRSGTYGSKERAMWAFENNRINWLEDIPISGLDPPNNDLG